MILAVMQPYFFPYMGYWQLINVSDKFIIFDDVNFIKKGWINRNRILLNGNDYLFTLPIKGASQNKHINEIELDDISGWSSKFVKTLDTAYRKAPHFIPVFGLLTSCFEYDNKNLSSFITNSVKTICNYLGIKTTIVDSSAIYNTAELKKDDKILSICRQEKASCYINPSGGQELYQKEKFSDNNIELKFLKMKNFQYKQFNNDFVPALSIIDVLMFNDKDLVKEYLLQFDLI